MKTVFKIEKDKLKILKKLKTPRRIQDFLDQMKINFEEKGDTCWSPMTVLENNSCHCLEGAVLAALALRVNGYPPLLLDLKADNNHDLDHVVAVFQEDGKWGALSKTNHVVLRYREPVYNSLRELTMSYFHEYYNRKGRKNLRSFSRPLNLKEFDKRGWMTTREEIEYIADRLDEIKHFPIVNEKQIRNFRKADKIEIGTIEVTEWRSKGWDKAF
jgi:hypothetical protein